MRADLFTVRIVNRYDVTLQILFKEVRNECACSIGVIPILQTDRSAILIVQIGKQMRNVVSVCPRFSQNQTADKIVTVLNSVYILARADAVGIAGRVRPPLAKRIEGGRGGGYD